jgi:hypothetical protein
MSAVAAAAAKPSIIVVAIIDFSASDPGSSF